MYNEPNVLTSKHKKLSIICQAIKLNQSII